MNLHKVEHTGEILCSVLSSILYYLVYNWCVEQSLVYDVKKPQASQLSYSASLYTKHIVACSADLSPQRRSIKHVPFQ